MTPSPPTAPTPEEEALAKLREKEHLAVMHARQKEDAQAVATFREIEAHMGSFPHVYEE